MIPSTQRPMGRAFSFLGGAGNDTITGGNQNDTISGGDGEDRLYGGGGANIFIAGSGDDFIWIESADDRIADGGAGYDRAYVIAAGETLRSSTRPGRGLSGSTLSLARGSTRQATARRS